MSPSAAATDRLGWMLDPDWDVPVRPVLVYDGEPVYSLQPKQLEAWAATPLNRQNPDPAEMIGYGGAAGAGKSHLARAVAAGVAMLWPGSTSILFRRTKKELKANHILKWLEEIPQELGSLNKTDGLFEWANGSDTWFGYLERDEHKFRYQGPEYDCMIFEEATHYRWETVSWLLDNRLRATVAGSRPFALFPSNPGNVGHFWFKRLFVERRYTEEEDPSAYVMVQARLEDNQIQVRRDPKYVQRLERLPEPWRSWLRDGDFSAGAGMAFPMLSRRTHVCDFFVPPDHWPRFGAFDWGYAHPFSFGYYAVDEDGRVHKCDTWTGRRMLIDEIISHLFEMAELRGLDLSKLQYIAADDIVFQKRGREHGYEGPTYGEKMIEAGLPVIPANKERIRGRQQLAEYLRLDDDGEPWLVFMDTPGNERCIQTLETRVEDPNNMEDVQKTDADEWGEGGDDEYDETRYGIASRPSRAKSVALEQDHPGAFAKETLEREARETRRVKQPKPRKRVRHPEFGDLW